MVAEGQVRGTNSETIIGTPHPPLWGTLSRRERALANASSTIRVLDSIGDRMPGMKRQLAISFALLFASAVLVHAADQFTGTWTLNVAKSKYSPGMPPKAQTTKLETLKDGIREIVDRVNADGSKTHWDFTAKFDGKDYPITGDPDRDMASVKKVDDYTLEVVNKKAGKVTTSMKLVVAKDGKSRTNTVTGKTSTGVDINNILFFDKN